MEKKYCNCANCGREAVGMSCAHLRGATELVIVVRVDDRPWCNACSKVVNLAIPLSLQCKEHA